MLTHLNITSKCNFGVLMSGEVDNRALTITADLVVLQALVPADELLQHQMIVPGGKALNQERCGVLKGLNFRSQGRLKVLLLLCQLLPLG